jgi:hypothetical protein
MACFPNAFAGAAIHSGVSYGLAGTLLDADKILTDGPPPGPVTAPCNPAAYKGAVFVIHGTADNVINPDLRAFLLGIRPEFDQSDLGVLR